MLWKLICATLCRWIQYLNLCLHSSTRTYCIGWNVLRGQTICKLSRNHWQKPIYCNTSVTSRHIYSKGNTHFVSYKSFNFVNPGLAQVLSDILHLLTETDCNTFREYPGEIYHSALIWLPTSVCAPLADERSKRSLPLVTQGLRVNWTKLNDRVGTGQQTLVTNSLFTSPKFTFARWLSISDDRKLMAHEWDTQTDSETQYSLGFPAYKRFISKIAITGIFFLELEKHILHFKPFPHSHYTMTRPQLRAKTWHIRDSGAHQRFYLPTELVISANGRYAAVWNEGQHRVWLVNVHKNVSHWLPPPENHSKHFSLCFSPDETYLVAWCDTSA